MDRLRASLVEVLDGVLSGHGLARGDWEHMLGAPKDASMADLVLPCFAFAKRLGMAPPQVAAQLADEVAAAAQIGVDGGEALLSSASAVGGFLNLRFHPMQLVINTVLPVLDGGAEAHLAVHAGQFGLLLLEHTSANPNGPFHVGRVRNAILGDTLVRLHRLAGEEVRAEFYVDDMGKQVAILAWAITNLTDQQVDELLESAGLEGHGSLFDHPGKQDHARVRWYQAANVLRGRDPDIEAELTALVHRSEQGDSDTIQLFEKAWQPILAGMLATLAELGIRYDTFTAESRFILDGSVAAVTDTLRSHELHVQADNGAHGIDISSLGMEKREFWFERADGSSLYVTRDIAYHQWKWTQAPRLLNVLGEDHRDQARTVGHMLEVLGGRAPECVFYAFIKLPGGKMSTRRGNVVHVDDLLQEAEERALVKVQELRPELEAEVQREIAVAVGRSAVRYDIAKVAAEKGFIFDWERALDFTGDSAPFIIYSHARAASIRRRVEAEGQDVDRLLAATQAMSVDDPGHVAEQVAATPESLRALMRRMAGMRGALAEAVRQHRSNLFATALLRLASDYNQFYRDCPVLEDGEVRVLNLAVSEAARRMLAAGCEGLGLHALEQM